MRELNRQSLRPRVLIADDHGIVAEGIRALLEQTCDVIGIVSDGRELIAEAPRLNPDVIVLDVGMPLLNGLDAAERLKELLPAAKFVFLTMQDDANLAAAVLKLGAVGFVLKHAAASELLTAVSQVLEAGPTLRQSFELKTGPSAKPGRGNSRKNSLHARWKCSSYSPKAAR